MDTVPREEQIPHYSIVASAPVHIQRSDSETFNPDWKATRVAWTMTLLPDSSSRDRWVTIDHFSTLTSGSIPASGMAFLDNFMKELMRAWLKLCESIDNHLRLCVSGAVQHDPNRDRPRANKHTLLSVQKFLEKMGNHGISSNFC
jgi:hypothetical protein